MEAVDKREAELFFRIIRKFHCFVYLSEFTIKIRSVHMV